MIRTNDSQTPENENDEAVRIFTKILRAANAHWGEFFYDDTKKLARGLLTTQSFGPCTAELTYNDIKQRLFLVVRFNVNNSETLSGSPAFLKFQNNTADLLSQVTVDEECRIANVRTITALTLSGAKHAVDAVFSDTFTLLENKDFYNLLN